VKKYKIKSEFKHDWFLFLVILAVILLSVLAYPRLPEKMATHWNLEGKVDGYSPRLFGAFLLPLMTLAIYLMMVIAPVFDPRRENYPKFIKGYRLFRLVLVLFLTGLHLLILGFNLGYPLDIGRAVTLGVGILFALIGNFFPQIRHNYFFGIKTPWTLASEQVWRKTHRLGGKLFLGSGLLLMLSVFLADKPRFLLLMALVLGSSLVTMVYSYVIYKKEKE